jgi:uncharacterized protein YbjT (DUF2867 family)
MIVFVAGATGYVGGRLVPRLLERGHSVRCLVRSARKADGRVWAGDPRVTLVEGDAGDPQTLSEALRGGEAAYYLIHSMEVAKREYRAEDRRLARTFAEAASLAGLKRIIYLGGLGETGGGLSEHLTSRREVEEALRSGTVPVTVLRAAMIIGSGSASFEILRYLVERLPAMVTPKWVGTENQPIAIRNTLHYLVTVLDTPETIGRTLDIGGPEIVTYREMMEIMAQALGLRRRLVLPVPVFTPRLSSLWIHLVTPVSRHIAQPLALGLRNRVVCRDGEAARVMPQQLLTVREAIDAALGRTEPGLLETSWRDAGVIPGDPDWAGGSTFTDRRSVQVAATPPILFGAVCRVGGREGWYSAQPLWRLRGILDRLLGGPGLQRGRRDPDHLAYGDVLDFWRVTGIDPDRRLTLRAEMKLPGEAILEFEVEPLPGGTASTLTQTAKFKPRGLAGLIYWLAVLPFHNLVFRGMVEGIRRRAERGSAAS